MSMLEIQKELDNKFYEDQCREKATKEQIKSVENIIRNETQECIDDFENPHERSIRYFKLDEINANISREKSRANMEKYKDRKIQREERGV